MIYEGYVTYHIKRKGMSLSEGYIGVTNNITHRMYRHRRSPYVVGRALRKYDDSYLKVLVYSTQAECLALEGRLRPKEQMGWNIAKGGVHSLPSPKGRILTAKHKANIGKSNKLTAQCKEIINWVHKDGREEMMTMYDLRIKHNITQSNISSVKIGKRKTASGWSKRDGGVS